MFWSIIALFHHDFAQVPPIAETLPVKYGSGRCPFFAPLDWSTFMRKASRLIALALTIVVALGVFVVAQQPAAGGGGSYSRVFAAAGRELRTWDTQVAAMERDRELKLRTVQPDTMIGGRRHERLDQFYRGVPVFGGEVVRETDGQVTLSVTASVYAGIDVDTTPSVSTDEALTAFRRETGATADTAPAPELMILPRNDGTYALVYRMTAFLGNKMQVVFVNAKTGAVELRYNNLKAQQSTALLGNGVLVGSGVVSSDQKKVVCASQGGTYLAWDMIRPTTIKTYDLKGNLSRVKDLFDGKVPLLPSDMASNTASTWTDSVVVDAHTYIGWTYDYYYTRHAWQGLNGNNGRSVYVVVHPVNRSDFTKYSADDQGTYYMNAFYCGSCGYSREDMMMIGEGLPAGYISTDLGGQKVDYQAAALDILAHEYSHGVTDYTSALIYRNESGALNEAFSDIMSAGVEFFQQPAGAGLLQADYLEGEDAWRPAKAGALSGLRSFVDPGAYGDPDHYTKRYTGTDDEGGVHTNSLIASHAFYLAVEGGKNRTSGITVTGAGAANRDKVERAFFRGFTTLTANANFSLARAKTIQAARDLYGSGSAIETAITQAWTAVGVN
jgi:Zn-dependent metalloprotease